MDLAYVAEGRLRVYRDGQLVAEIPPEYFPKLIAEMGAALIGKVTHDSDIHTARSEGEGERLLSVGQGADNPRDRATPHRTCRVYE